MTRNPRTPWRSGAILPKRPAAQDVTKPPPADQTCPVCGRVHWHPAGAAVCVSCTLERMLAQRARR